MISAACFLPPWDGVYGRMVRGDKLGLLWGGASGEGQEFCALAVLLRTA
jgi:hypothetical protein